MVSGWLVQHNSSVRLLPYRPYRTVKDLLSVARTKFEDLPKMDTLSVVFVCTFLLGTLCTYYLSLPLYIPKNELLIGMKDKPLLMNTPHHLPSSKIQYQIQYSNSEHCSTLRYISFNSDDDYYSVRKFSS